MKPDTKRILWRAAEFIQAYEDRFGIPVNPCQHPSRKCSCAQTCRNRWKNCRDNSMPPRLCGPLDDEVEALRTELRNKSNG